MITITQFFLISLSIYTVNGTHGTDKLASSLGQMPPLILINTYTITLEKPTHVTISTNLRLQRMIEFRAPNSSREVFFCLAASQKQKNFLQKETEVRRKLDAEKTQLNPIDEITAHCLLGKTTIKRSFSPLLPQCKHEPQPVILRNIGIILSKKEILYKQMACGRTEENAKRFIIGYQICVDFSKIDKIVYLMYKSLRYKGSHIDRLQEFSLYKLCYDYGKSQILHTRHSLMSPKLFQDEVMKQEREKVYHIDTFGHNEINIQFESLKEVSEKIEKTNIEKYQRLDNLQNLHQFHFKKQFLVSPDDFAFGLWRKTNYHYANVSFIQETLLQTWNQIGKLIRDFSIKLDVEFEIYTGAFKLSPSTSDRVYTIEGIQIPEIWFKIVHHNYINPFPKTMKDKYRKTALAIIANNYLTDDISKQIDYYSEEDLCPHTEPEEFSNFSSLVKCCAVTDSVQDLFGIRLEFEDVLAVENVVMKSNGNQSP